MPNQKTKISFSTTAVSLSVICILGLLAAAFLTADLLNITDTETENKVIVGSYAVTFPEDEASLQAMADQLKYEMEKTEATGVEPAAGETDSFGMQASGKTNSLFSFFTPVSQ
jgi:hypothetical protein